MSDSQMKNEIDGWMFSDQATIEWTEVEECLSMKMLGSAGGRVLALFRLDAGYVGGLHTHTEAEFTYVLEGSVVCKGVPLCAGQSYAAEAGTAHDPPLRTDDGALIVSVYAPHEYPEDEAAE